MEFGAVQFQAPLAGVEETRFRSWGVLGRSSGKKYRSIAGGALFCGNFCQHTTWQSETMTEVIRFRTGELPTPFLNPPNLNDG